MILKTIEESYNDLCEELSENSNDNYFWYKKDKTYFIRKMKPATMNPKAEELKL